MDNEQSVDKVELKTDVDQEAETDVAEPDVLQVKDSKEETVQEDTLINNDLDDVEEDEGNNIIIIKIVKINKKI